MLENKEALDVVYENLFEEKNLDEASYDQIDKDIKRTYFPPYFEAKKLKKRVEKTEADLLEIARLEQLNTTLLERTRNVLVAYAVKDKTVGYIQGFNSIVACLVYIFHVGQASWASLEEKPAFALQMDFSEAEVFYTFYGLMYQLNWRDNFAWNLDSIQEMCEEFKERLRLEDSKLFSKFFQNEVRVNLIDPTGGLLRRVLPDHLPAHHAHGHRRQDSRPVLDHRRKHCALHIDGSAYQPKAEAPGLGERAEGHRLPQERYDEGPFSERLTRWHSPDG